MKKIVLFIIVVMPYLVQAQSTLSGKVKDMDGHPLDAATITLKRDNKQVAAAFADLGNFELKYQEKGTYVISASLVGYQTLELVLQLPKESVLLVLQPDSKQLEEVKVTFQPPVIQRKIDRVTFNVEQSILASGGSAWEALTKAPGVQVSSSNEVTANRKNVQIYLDGKPINLSGDELSAYLQGLPSDLIAQIEVFSNPPAKFEAEGAAIINIITRKAKKEGLNLTLNSGISQGDYSNYNASSTFNYRNDKLNIYGSYGFIHRQVFVDHNLSIDYGKSFWNSINRIVSPSDNHSYRAGADYQLRENQVLGFMLTGNHRIGKTRGHSGTEIINLDMLVDSTLSTENTSSGKTNQYAYNLNYNLKLDSGKRSLNIDVDYAPYQNRSDAYTDNLSFLPDGQQTTNRFHIFTPSAQKIAIYSGKVDYTYHLFGKLDVGSGIKYSSTESRNNFDYFNRESATLILVPENSNHFIYREKTSSAYTSIAGTFGKLSIQGGIRAEYTRTSGYSATLDVLNQRNYFKLFPTAFFQYKLDDENELQLNYAYRIERPEYNRLNPAKRFSSPYNIYVGNPALQPSFVQNIELGYTYKKNYNVTATYRVQHDIFTNINVQDNETKIYYGTQANLGLSRNAGIQLSAAFHPAAWWDMNLLTEGYWQQEKSAYLSSSYNFNIISYYATLKHAFTIDQKSALKAELSGTFTGPGLQGIYRASHNSSIDAGIKMNVLHGMGTVRLSATDIFNTYTNNISINYLDQRSAFFHHNESRYVALSLSYKLGKNVAASRSRSTASEEERKRAQ
ncbi:TonB-dependent receptor domain-containing protein [Pedobacter sp. SAFR-022]|uniref:TonB-dependent receptor domain-containing protein n=1 Tax=Pedobacter sp. SAFR-022 TaxID=3436861 RepID=UPI003F7F0B7B